ncbi:MAG: hypothetical protein JNL70_27900 [Saprospiraceae bacterium]|nr:hypothetical protein [Saprospiraceae bacterium]
MRKSISDKNRLFVAQRAEFYSKILRFNEPDFIILRKILTEAGSYP